jgi:tripartite-type tricarboxylate transporter receptor subunit TctC
MKFQKIWYVVCRQFIFIGLAFALLQGPVMAAEFPSKPITLICPWGAGGTTDIYLRSLGEAASKHLGQPVVIENKPGGGGTAGPSIMAGQAKPDGYTITQIPMGIFRYPHMMKVSYDPLKDFTYIIQLAGYAVGVVVKVGSPWKTWDELIRYSKANPGKISFASTGVGTATGMTMELISLKQGLKWIHVPFKSAGETITALLGDHVHAAADTMVGGGAVDSGELRLLVTWGNERTKRWPHVPTLKELGYGIVANSPFGLAGPKGMDPKVVKTLHDAFKKGMEDPAFRKISDKFEMEAFYKNSEEYTKYAKELFDEGKEIVEALGLKKQ